MALWVIITFSAVAQAGKANTDISLLYNIPLIPDSFKLNMCLIRTF